ncbi:hypothetical protein AB0M44_36230 [Streptosporangium subroseum]|uniref:hypothetical protein n=1 Tax=Streptosporangium subroseum TaxID=106412 RepID=UPI0034132624
MGEDEGGFDDVANAAGADGDALEGAPPLGKQGEAAFAQAAQGPPAVGNRLRGDQKLKITI